MKTITIYCEQEPQDVLRDLDMVLHPEKWPCWPILPLRHKTERDPMAPSLPLLGFVLADKPTTVVKGCMYLSAAGIHAAEAMAEQAYESVSKMLGEWQVD